MGEGRAGMSRVDIHIQKISTLPAQFTSLASKTNVVEQTVRSLKASVPQKVQARRNISARISQIASELSEAEADIRKLSAFTQFATEEYTQAEKKVQNSIEKAANNGLIPHPPGKGKDDGILDYLDFKQYIENLKNFFGDPKTRAEWLRDGLDIYNALTYLPGLISGGIATAGQLSWMKLINKLGYEVTSNGIRFKNLVLSPRMQGMLDFFNRNLSKIEGTKLAGFLKFKMLGFSYSFFKHGGKTISNLIPKALTGVFVDDINSFFKALDKYSLERDINGFKTALKNNVSNIFSSSKGLLKANALTGLLIEGVSEIGKGYVQWQANNIEFANDTAKRNYENAKIVRTGAIDVAGTVAGGTVGTVIGATLGSVLGPVGTVAVGAAGGMIGSFVGGQVAKGVNKAIDFVSSKFWDPHRDTNKTSTIDQVKEKSKGLLKSASDFFLKPVFGGG